MDKHDDLLSAMRGQQEALQAILAGRSALQVGATADRADVERLAKIVGSPANGEPPHAEQLRELQRWKEQMQRLNWILIGALITAAIGAAVLWLTKHLIVV